VLRVDSSGYGTEFVRFSALTRKLSVFMSPEAVVEGVVLRRTDRTPVANAVVTVNSATQVYTTISDQDGRFRQTGVKPGRIRVSGAAHRLVRRKPRVHTVEVEVVEPLELLLDTAVAIKGRVLKDKRPVVGARVMGLVDAYPTFTVVSQNDGVFKAEVPTGGLSFIVAGFRIEDPDAQLTVTDATGPIDLHVIELGSISGTVRLAGEPTTGIPVSATADASERRRHGAESDGTGRFEIVGLETGDYSVEAGSTTRGIARETVHVGPNAMHRVIDLELKDGATISGRVVTPVGAAVDNVVVRFHRNDGGDYSAARTNQSGQFRVLAMAGSGLYQASVRPDAFLPIDFPAGHPDGLPLIELKDKRSRVTGVEIVIDNQMADISGAVSWSSKAAVPDALVELPNPWDSYPPFIAVTTTDARGEFRIRDVPRSQVVLRASAHGVASTVVTLGANERRVELVLPDGP
jgi:hypothetical protein